MKNWTFKQVMSDAIDREIDDIHNELKFHGLEARVEELVIGINNERIKTLESLRCILL
jgi:hypothetical protein